MRLQITKSKAGRGKIGDGSELNPQKNLEIYDSNWSGDYDSEKNIMVFNKPEMCPFCSTYNVYHMMPIGNGPSMGCKKCRATWTPLLKIENGEGESIKFENKAR